MFSLLAYAEGADTSDRNLVMMFGGLLILAGVGAAGFVVVYLAKRRRGSVEVVLAGVFFWGLITAGSLLYFMHARMQWTKEYGEMIESGYFDPRDMSGRPEVPWGLWGGLAVAYGGMVGWAVRGKRVGGNDE
jgi:hypothetical protein